MSEESKKDAMQIDTPTPKPPPKKNLHITPSASAETTSKHPNMELAQRIHRVTMMATGVMDAEACQAVGMDVKTLHKDVLAQVCTGEKKVEKDLVEKPDEKDKEKDTTTSTTTTKDKKKKEEEEEDLSASIENVAVYNHLLSILSPTPFATTFTPLPSDTLTSLSSHHASTLTQLEALVEEARESAGDMEVLAARFRVARFAAKSLSKEEALEAYDKVLNLPKLSTGKTIDGIMEAARVASFHGDTKRHGELVERAVKLASDGGDWDRRNRLKVYDALSKLLNRNVKDAASLLIDCVATFSCTELCSYNDFIVYTIVTNVLHLPRTELKEKIVDGPEILQIEKDIPVVYKLVQSLYECNYQTYLQTLVNLHPILLADRFLQPHAGYLLRELHVLGYKQFLDSYKSVTLESMAKSFGVSCGYLDLQLSRFIAAGRLTAKIDKFGGVVETNRPDLKNAQYRDMIQKGDLLLNRIQKLARVVDL